jgi:hypothetical protein
MSGSRVHRVEARLSWDEKADLNALALRRGLTPSGLMRSLIVHAIETELARDGLPRTVTPQRYRDECCY